MIDGVTVGVIDGVIVGVTDGVIVGVIDGVIVGWEDVVGSTEGFEVGFEVDWSVVQFVDTIPKSVHHKRSMYRYCELAYAESQQHVQ